VLQGTICQQGLAAGIGSDTMNCMYHIGQSWLCNSYGNLHRAKQHNR